ncbi:MAG: hypothetical protein AMXMBFR57_00860 [Acidimicrobiia bacterium]|jgi:hypothetical protein
MIAAALIGLQGGGRGGGAGGAGAAVRPALELTLAAPVEMPDGRRLGATAIVTQGPEPWFVYSGATLCDSAITRGLPPQTASEGWRVTVTERGRTNNQITAAVTWTRIFERGRAVEGGSSGSSEITLQLGDRIPLDRVTRSTPVPECAATQKSIELRLGVRLSRSNPASEPRPSDLPDAQLATPVSVELWMVHVVPGKPEIVERQTIRLAEGGSGFLFRGQPVDSPAGPVVLELNGQLRPVQRADGTIGLWTGLTRSVTSHLTGRTYSSTGTGEKVVDWLAAGDVVSFDLPDPAVYAPTATGARGTGGGGGGGAAVGGLTGGRGGVGGGRGALGPNLLEGHHLSLRVRLAHVK